jgi:ribonuclease HI
MKTDYLALQIAREPFKNWSEFPGLLERDKMVHVMTDRGARPNPGSAGWSPLIKHIGFCTFNYGHYDHATNNAMEIRAVVEALRTLSEQMHVWISTDSAYVKEGITKRLPNWLRNRWRNSQGAAVANKTLCQKLYELVGKQRRVEWSWVRAHNGTLLDECADTSATKGVMNEPRQEPAQILVPINEDTDSEEYVTQDGEDTPLVDGRDDLIPEGCTFVMKDDDRFLRFLSDSEDADDEEPLLAVSEAPAPCEPDWEFSEQTSDP